MWSTAACSVCLSFLSLLVSEGCTFYTEGCRPLTSTLFSFQMCFMTHAEWRHSQRCTPKCIHAQSCLYVHSWMYRHTSLCQCTDGYCINIHWCLRCTHTNTHTGTYGHTSSILHHEQIIVITLSLATAQCDRIIVLSIMLIQNELYSGDYKISHSGWHFNYVLNSRWYSHRFV